MEEWGRLLLEKQSRPREERAESEDRASSWRKGKQRRFGQRSGRRPRKRAFQRLLGSGRREAVMWD